MPIISESMRKHPKVRVLHAVICLVLAAGAVTMIYPFLLMLSGSTKSGVDSKRMDVVPLFWYDDTMLYRKHIEGLFNESLAQMNMAYSDRVPSFEVLEPPAGPNRALVGVWQEFLKETNPPPYASALGYIGAEVSRTTPQCLREFKSYVAEQYGPDIESVNRQLGTQFVNWNGFFILPEKCLARREVPSGERLVAALWDFKLQQPEAIVYHFSPEGFFKRQFVQTQYGKDIAGYNQAHSTGHESYDGVHLSRRLPGASELAKQDWEAFVRHTLNLLWIRADSRALGIYQDFLKAKYVTIDVLNRNYATACASFEDVPLVDEPPIEGIVLSDWQSFVAGWQDPDTKQIHILPADMLIVHSLEFQFRDYLQARYQTLEAVNAALGTSYGDFMAVIPPQRDAHYLAFLDMKGPLRWEFTTRNYLTVIDYMVLHGRGIVNTLIYCSLAVLAALIVNPLAAYAMSRHKITSSYKILLLLLLPMAFPPMVTQIPAFLMLREMHLLNTFAALILPGMASGFSVFLLKGFFDSLPRELYEAAAVDGAGEWTIFWNITMSLSKPILAVIALGAFTAAYANFMFALLICQDQNMWTLMVWLYELQQRCGQSVIYASLIIAAIPTFVVFVFCQKIILRGIVVPSEK